MATPPRPPPQPSALLLAGVRARKRNKRIGTTTVFVKLEDHAQSGAKALIVYKGEAAVDGSVAERAAHPEEDHKNCWLLADIDGVTSEGSEATVAFNDGRRQTLVCSAGGQAQQFASELNWQLRALRVRSEDVSLGPPAPGASPPPSAAASPAPSSARSTPSPVSTKRVLRKTALRFRIGAANLVDPNGTKSCNPYVVVFARRDGREAEVTRTAVLRNVADPGWDALQLDIEAVCGAVRDPDQTLTFRIMNEDRTPQRCALRKRRGAALVFSPRSLPSFVRLPLIPPPPPRAPFYSYCITNAATAACARPRNAARDAAIGEATTSVRWMLTKASVEGSLLIRPPRGVGGDPHSPVEGAAPVGILNFYKVRQVGPPVPPSVAELRRERQRRTSATPDSAATPPASGGGAEGGVPTRRRSFLSTKSVSIDSSASRAPSPAAAAPSAASPPRIAAAAAPPSKAATSTVAAPWQPPRAARGTGGETFSASPPRGAPAAAAATATTTPPRGPRVATAAPSRPAHTTCAACGDALSPNESSHSVKGALFALTIRLSAACARYLCSFSCFLFLFPVPASISVFRHRARRPPRARPRPSQRCIVSCSLHSTASTRKLAPSTAVVPLRRERISRALLRLRRLRRRPHERSGGPSGRSGRFLASLRRVREAPARRRVRRVRRCSHPAFCLRTRGALPRYVRSTCFSFAAVSLSSNRFSRCARAQIKRVDCSLCVQKSGEPVSRGLRIATLPPPRPGHRARLFASLDLLFAHLFLLSPPLSSHANGQLLSVRRVRHHARRRRRELRPRSRRELVLRAVPRSPLSAPLCFERGRHLR